MRNKKYARDVFFILRRLEETTNSVGNSLVSVKYNHKRFKYVLNNQGGVHLDLVHSSDILYPTFNVVDPTILVHYFTVQTTNVNKLETDKHRPKSRFFMVHGVPLTSFKEHIVTNVDSV